MLQTFSTVPYITILEEYTPRICAVHFIAVFTGIGLSWFLSHVQHFEDNIIIGKKAGSVPRWQWKICPHLTSLCSGTLFFCRVCLRNRIIAQSFKAWALELDCLGSNLLFAIYLLCGLGKVLNLSVPQFPRLLNEEDDNTWQNSCADWTS